MHPVVSLAILPLVRRLDAEDPQRRAQDEMAFEVERIVDGRLHAEKTLGNCGSGLKALAVPFLTELDQRSRDARLRSQRLERLIVSHAAARQYRRRWLPGDAAARARARAPAPAAVSTFKHYADRQTADLRLVRGSEIATLEPSDGSSHGPPLCSA